MSLASRIVRVEENPIHHDYVEFPIELEHRYHQKDDVSYSAAALLALCCCVTNRRVIVLIKNCCGLQWLFAVAMLSLPVLSPQEIRLELSQTLTMATQCSPSDVLKVQAPTKT